MRSALLAGLLQIGTASGLALGAAALIVFTEPQARASASLESGYGFDRTWNSALRLVRVDMGLKVTEKDEQSGYLLFDYKSPESAKPTPGSLELVRSQDPSGPVRVVAQLPQMPRYHEQALLDALSRKLRNEYGEAPARDVKKPAPVDAGSDAAPQE